VEVEVFLIPPTLEEEVEELVVMPFPPILLLKEVNAAPSLNMSAKPPNPPKPPKPPKLGKELKAEKKGSSCLLWTEAVEE
jgi:hypothetical protein